MVLLPVEVHKYRRSTCQGLPTLHRGGAGQHPREKRRLDFCTWSVRLAPRCTGEKSTRDRTIHSLLACVCFPGSLQASTVFGKLIAPSLIRCPLWDKCGRRSEGWRPEAHTRTLMLLAPNPLGLPCFEADTAVIALGRRSGTSIEKSTGPCIKQPKSYIQSRRMGATCQDDSDTPGVERVPVCLDELRRPDHPADTRRTNLKLERPNLGKITKS